MKKPEVLLLDLGNVVFQLDWLRPIHLLSLQESKFEKILTEQIQTWGPYDQFERGKLSSDDFLGFINQICDEKIAKESFIQAWASLIVGYMHGMEELLQELSHQLPLYALTNTNPLHYDHIIKSFPEMSLFKKIFTSIHTGFRKPEREIFELVSEEIGVLPGDILYIDDCAGHVDAARLFGYRSEIYTGSNALDLRRLLGFPH